MNVLRATVAVMSFTVLVALDNPIQQCWMGWDLPKIMDLGMVFVVYSTAFVMAGIFPALMTDQEGKVMGFQEAIGATNKT